MTSRPSGSSTLHQSNKTVLFVGRVPHEAIPEDIEEHFAAYGQVEKIDWPTVYDESIGARRHQGFCYVCFVDDADAKKVLQNEFQQLRRFPMAKDIFVQQSMNSMSKGERQRLQKAREDGSGLKSDGKTVWIGGLPHPATPEEIEEHFSQFGKVVHIEWPMRWDKKLNVDRHKGFCKLTFADRAACGRAVIKREFEMVRYPGKEMVVEVMKEAVRQPKKKNTKQKKGNQPLSRQGTDNSGASRKKSVADNAAPRQSSSRFFPRSSTKSMRDSLPRASLPRSSMPRSSLPRSSLPRGSQERVSNSARWNWASGK